MTRVVFTLALAVALTTSQVDAVPKTGFHDSTCQSATYIVSYPLQNITNGTLVLTAEEFTPVNAIAYIRACGSGDKLATMNGSDPSTWRATIPGQCGLVKFDRANSSIGCEDAYISVEVSQLSEHCNQDPSAGICDPLPTPAPSGAVPQVLIPAAAVALAVLGAVHTAL